jgi:hypothetical protein
MDTITIAKGNVLRNTKFDTHALVLAMTKDGNRAKLHVFGRDEPVWHPVTWYEVIEQGDHVCWKCSGSGLFYFGGPIVNGVYQGRTGPCFGCEGTGQQSNADRLRCHYYWHRSHGEGRHADLMPDEYDHLSDNPSGFEPDTSDFQGA